MDRSMTMNTDLNGTSYIHTMIKQQSGTLICIKMIKLCPTHKNNIFYNIRQYSLTFLEQSHILIFF